MRPPAEDGRGEELPASSDAGAAEVEESIQPSAKTPARPAPDVAAHGPSARGETAHRDTPRRMSVALDVPFQWRAVHIFALVGFAVVQPLFAVLGDGPEFFIAHDASPIDILLFVAAVTVLVPLVLVTVEGIAALLTPSFGAVLQLFLVGGLVAVIIAPVLDKTSMSGWMVTALSLIGGGLAAALYFRAGIVRTFLSILGLAPILFAALFLFGTPVSAIAFSSNEAAAAGSVTGDNPVILIVFDEMSAEVLMTSDFEIDSDLFPNFARLGHHATWYRNATSVEYETSYSIPAILTGNRWEGGQKTPIVSEYPENLFVLLSEQYSVNAVEIATHLCPDSVCAERQTEPLPKRLQSLTSDATAVYLNIITPEDFSDRLPVVTQTWGGFAAEGSSSAEDEQFLDDWTGAVSADRRDVLEGWVGGVTAAPATLHFLHSALPHVPWEYLPSGKRYRPTGHPGLYESEWGPEEWAVAQGLQRHILQTQYVDRVLGELLDSLEQDGTFDESMIIITADHGVSFIPEGQRRHVTEDNYWDIFNVPLFVKYPNQEVGGISDANVESIDLLPTIVDVLGIDVPWQFDGHSMLDGIGNPRKNVVVVRPDAEVLDIPPGRPNHLPLLEQKVRLAGDDPTQADIYAIGPHSDLVGRRITQFERMVDPTFDASLEQPLVDYDPDSRYAPSWVQGKVTSVDGTEHGYDLALAVNDTIAAVTRTLSWQGQHDWFSFIVPEEAFSVGRNKLEVFRVDDGDSGATLTATFSREFALDLATMNLVASDGERIPIEQGQALAYLDQTSEVDGGIRFTGWALDLANSRPPDAIVIFEDDRMLTQTVPNSERPDAARAIGAPDLAGENLGFSFTIGGLASEFGTDRQVRVFAIFGDRATELDYPDDYQWNSSG